MSRRILIVAALPRELKPLVRGWARQPSPKPIDLWATTDAEGDELVAVCAGMGAFAAGRAFAAAGSRGPIDMVLSVGLAGATGPDQVPGQVRAASEVIDVQTGERFPMTTGPRHLRLATVAQTAGSHEKARLLASYGAALVDMEAATIARLAAMRGLPVGCFKAVSDEADAALPEIDRFVDHTGQLSVSRFVAHLALQPRSWGAVARLARSSAQASEGLALSVHEFLRHKDLAYTNRTGKFAVGEVPTT